VEKFVEEVARFTSRTYGELRLAKFMGTASRHSGSHYLWAEELPDGRWLYLMPKYRGYRLGVSSDRADQTFLIVYDFNEGDEAWRAAYQGIIPGNELDKLINRRGPDWWDSAIRKGSRITVLQFGDSIAGYANYGRNRARSLFYDGEVYELYLRPEFQGLGFGRRLFTAARKDLIQSGLKSLVVWALSDNDPAMEFYRALGGRAVARSSEKFGAKTLDKVAYAWQ